MILKDLYKPTQEFAQDNIADALKTLPVSINLVTTTVDSDQIKRSLKQKMDNFLTDSDPLPPLTLDESLEFDQQYGEMLTNLADTKARYDGIIKYIDQIAYKANVSFILDIEKKKRIKKALTRLFGSDSNIISYAQYKALLEAKAALELAGMEDYKKGFADE